MPLLNSSVYSFMCCAKMIRELALLILISVVACHPAPDASHPTGPNPTVTIPLGKIQGTVINSRLGKHIFSFRGIKYAKAPINELRFQVSGK